MVLAYIPSRVPPGKIQPGSQALSSASLSHWKKDPGCGWSCDHPESGG